MVPSLIFTFKNTQHGFRKGRSIETNLLCFYNALIKSTESGKQTDVIYTYFSKAFHSVKNPVFIEKFKFYGISDYLIFWFRSYLANYGFLSDPFPVPSGVPQWGYLSSLLFTICIIDISTCFKFCDYVC